MTHINQPARVQTLGQFIIERQQDFPYAKGELSRLLRDIGRSERGGVGPAGGKSRRGVK